MPVLATPTKTWVLGTHTIYNYQTNGDRGHKWFGKSDVNANLLFGDMHVGGLFRVPVGVVNVTPEYTFLAR